MRWAEVRAGGWWYPHGAPRQRTWAVYVNNGFVEEYCHIETAQRIAARLVGGR